MWLSVLHESIELKIELTTETRESRPWDHDFLVKKNKMDGFLWFQFTFGFGKFRNKGNCILNIILGSTDWGKTILKKNDL